VFSAVILGRSQTLLKGKSDWLPIVVLVFLIGVHCPIASAQQAKKAFTVADEISLSLFDDPDGVPG